MSPLSLRIVVHITHHPARFPRVDEKSIVAIPGSESSGRSITSKIWRSFSLMHAPERFRLRPFSRDSITGANILAQEGSAQVRYNSLCLKYWRWFDLPFPFHEQLT